MRQGPPALPLAASAGAALPGLDCCRRTRRSAAIVVAGRVPSGEVCRLSTSGAVLRAQHLVTEGEFSRWSDMVCPSLPAMTQGGRAMIQHQRAQRQRSSPHLPICRSTCLKCQVPASVCLIVCMKYSAASCVSIRHSQATSKISSGSSRRCACDAPAARAYARKGSRAIL